MTTKKMSYQQQLLDVRWQKKRLEVFQSAEWQCENCGEQSRTLHCHHRHYIKGRMAWEYDRAELQALCDACHTARHKEEELFKRIESVTNAFGSSYGIAAPVLCGYYETHYVGDELLTSEVLEACGKSYYIMGKLMAYVAIINSTKVADFLQENIKRNDPVFVGFVEELRRISVALEG